MVFGLNEQDVNMVAHGIDFDERRLVIFENASDVSVKLSALLVTQEGDSRIYELAGLEEYNVQILKTPGPKNSNHKRIVNRKKVTPSPKPEKRDNTFSQSRDT